MKIINSQKPIHVLNSQSNVWSIINEIANSGLQEDAFYVCDVGDIVHKHRIWKNYLPRVQPFYAVKCNDALTVLEVLAALGTGFDCASKNEIHKVLNIGVNSDRIIFANPAKPASHIRYAQSTGVSTLTFDNESELYKIKELYSEAKLVIRIRCDASEAQCPLGIKFGCNPITEAPALLQKACELNLNIVGVSFHVGSGCRDPAAFKKAIATSREIFDLANSFGYNFNLLDIGGGFPGDFGTSIEETASFINLALDIYFPDPFVHVIAEPGRFYVSSAYTLTCSIHSIRNIINDKYKQNPHKMYFINDGVYGSFNCILYDHQKVTAKPLLNLENHTTYSSSIWGPTCDGLDQVIEDILLPEMHIGDWIVFENMGAYTLPVASPFNGFPVSKVYMVADENIWSLFKNYLSLSDDNLIMNKNQHWAGTNLKNEDNKEFKRQLPIEISIGNFESKHILEYAG